MRISNRAALQRPAEGLPSAAHSLAAPGAAGAAGAPPRRVASSGAGSVPEPAHGSLAARVRARSFAAELILLHRLRARSRPAGGASEHADRVIGLTARAWLG